MRTAMVCAVIAVAAVVGPAAAQQSPEQRIRATLEDARVAGLPVQLLESKVAEGRAKNVALERIAVVVEQRAAAMSRAQRVLGGVMGAEPVVAEDMAVAADAIQAGVSEAAVAQIASTSGGQRRTVALAALAQLVADGVVPEEALLRVRNAMARGNEALMNVTARGGRPEGAGPPAGVPAAGRPAGKGPPPHAGPPEGKPGGGKSGGGGSGG